MLRDCVGGRRKYIFSQVNIFNIKGSLPVFSSRSLAPPSYQAGPLVRLDELAGALDDAVHEDGLDARVKPTPVGHGEVSEGSLQRHGGI